MENMLRRTFLQTAGGAAAASAYPAPAARIKLGIDPYSIRDLRWKALDLLNYAGNLKLDAIQFSSLNDYESLEPAHLQKVREDAERRGIQIDAGVGCICPTSSAWNPATGDAVQYVLKGLSVARAVGSKSMRCFLGSGADRRGKLPIEAHIEATVKVLRAVRSQALDAGVKIALENHSGDMQAWELRALIEEAGRDFVGCCLDIGNPMLVVEDPMVTLETLAPYVVTTHFRDSVVYEHPRGAAFQWVAMGDGSLDLRALVARCRELCPEAAMQLEIITGRPPQVLPYYEAEFWKVFPKARAAEFARFVALAKAGHPFMGAMVIAGPGRQPPEIQAALKQQQRRDLERSLEYARKELGAGIRG
ncbi:MAG: sugar phosphate isomerase/epimerase family protein [Rhodospirillales bacterium]